ncbi:hypothetical protein GCM10027436_28010 [Actinophytocola sediminis]
MCWRRLAGYATSRRDTGNRQASAAGTRTSTQPTVRWSVGVSVLGRNVMTNTLDSGSDNCGMEGVSAGRSVIGVRGPVAGAGAAGCARRPGIGPLGAADPTG